MPYDMNILKAQRRETILFCFSLQGFLLFHSFYCSKVGDDRCRDNSTAETEITGSRWETSFFIEQNQSSYILNVS